MNNVINLLVFNKLYVVACRKFNFTPIQNDSCSFLCHFYQVYSVFKSVWIVIPIYFWLFSDFINHFTTLGGFWDWVAFQLCGLKVLSVVLHSSGAPSNTTLLCGTNVTQLSHFSLFSCSKWAVKQDLSSTNFICEQESNSPSGYSQCLFDALL